MHIRRIDGIGIGVEVEVGKFGRQRFLPRRRIVELAVEYERVAAHAVRAFSISLSSAVIASSYPSGPRPATIPVAAFEM